MKQLLLFIAIVIAYATNINAQTYSGSLLHDPCPPTTSSNTQNTYTITAPSNGKYLLSGSMSANYTECGTNTTTQNNHQIYLTIEETFIDANGNTASAYVYSEFGDTLNTNNEWFCVKAGETYNITFNLNPSSYTQGSYNVSFTFVPTTYNNDTEPNNTNLEATNTSENTNYQGQLHFGIPNFNESTDNEDRYKITVPRNGNLQVSALNNSSNSLVNNYIHIYNETDVSDFTSQFNSLLNGSVNANVNCVKQGEILYVVLSGECSSYSFSWQVTPITGFVDNEPNDLSSQALNLLENQNATGNLGNGVNFLAGGTNEDLIDWYTFTTTKQGELNINLTTSITDYGAIEVYYQNPTDNSLIYLADTMNTASLTANCIEDGTYFIKLTTFSNTNNGDSNNGSLNCPSCCITYTLNYVITEPNVANDIEPNNVYTQAQNVTSGSTITGRLNYEYVDLSGLTKDYLDYYKLQTTSNGSIQVNFTAPIFQEGEANIYEEDAGTLSNTEFTVNTNANNLITSIIYNCASSSENYYLELTASNCFGYEFNYTSTAITNNDTEPNNTFTTAQTFNNTALGGNIGYGNLNIDNYDYFIVNATESAPTVINYATLSNNVNLTLYENETTPIVVAASNSNSLIYNNFDANNTYHIEVTTNGICDTYTLQGWQQAFTASNDTEPNNNNTQALPITFNTNHNGRLSFYNSTTDSNDWYTFTLNTTDNVDFILNAYEGLNCNAILNIYDNSFGYVNTVTHDCNNTARTSNTFNLTAGTYYINIESNDNQTGSYVFKVIPQNTLNVSGSELENLINIYPNPVNNYLSIKISSTINDSKITLYNTLGKLILKQGLNATNNQINMSNFANGIYFIKIETETNSITKRIIKN